MLQGITAMAGAAAAVAAGNYHNIVSQSLSLLSLFFAALDPASSATKRCSQSDKTEIVVGPRNAHF